MATSITTGIVASRHNATGKNAVVNIHRQTCNTKTATQYQEVLSSRGETVPLVLQVEGQQLHFSIFKDVKCVAGQKVTVVRDDCEVTHVINHSDEKRYYVGPDHLHGYYAKHITSPSTIVSALKVFIAQLLVIVAAFGGASVGKRYLENMFSQDTWNITVVASLMLTLLVGNLIFRSSKVSRNLHKSVKQHVKMQSHYFYMMTLWIYPMLSYAHSQNMITITYTLYAICATIVVTVAMGYWVVTRPANAISQQHACDYEMTIQQHLANLTEREKDLWLYNRAA